MKWPRTQNGSDNRSGAGPGNGGGPGFGRARGIRVPLPILFFLLMTLVIISVFDIMSQSQEVHQIANRRVAKVILDSTLNDVHTNLNGYAARLALQAEGPNVDLNRLLLEPTTRFPALLSQRVLILYMDEAGQVTNGYVGSEPLTRLTIDQVSADVEARRTLFSDTDGAASALRLIRANAVDYVISDSRALAGRLTVDGPSHVMIGLPVEELLVNKLKNYEIFSTGSLSRYFEEGRIDRVGSISQLVAELQNEEYVEFHLDAVVQIFIVLVAFVICVMIGQHIDEKNNALEQSHADLVDQEQEAQRLRNLAEKASEAKSRFIANMSHELRTPLNAVLGYSELIMNETYGKLEGAQRHYKGHAENIHTGGMRLLNQISQVLDFSALEMGEIELTRQDVALEQVISEIFGNYADRLSAKDLKLESDFAPALPRLLADRGKIADLFRHLISNAIKFSNVGGTVWVRARVDQGNSMEVCVKDDGEGMDSDRLDAISLPFVQGHDIYSRSHQGIGLGLTLAKAYAELHGAVLSIESKPDVGTQVTVTFPPDLTIGDHHQEGPHRPGYGDTPLALSR